MNAAMYIEVKGNKVNKGKIFPWVGYIYADKEINPKDYKLVKKSVDQWDNPVKVYKGNFETNLETPGGVESTDLYVLFDKRPEIKNV
jgi:hypothetical protein